ncbi:Glycosyltransferase, GT2 family [Actinomyces denticolens]|uniref:Glycosyltransferase, GT2 family n=1 Tax=Actinomyces denticolens TaxID=52767 RepID=A0ABY1HY37_9ACTO|nr:glycosyltransferase [Actinomyces denticolens]SHI29484.1 Glycosyltransferase, GT2 family [Actinomyces denticolens]
MTRPGPEAPSSAETAPGAGAGRAQDETLAVVVTAGVTAFLPRTLAALAAQTTLPAAVLVVDVASRANGLGDGTPVEEAVEASGLDLVTAVRILRAPAAPTLGGAVARGLALAQERAAARPRPEASDEDEGRPILGLDLDPADARWLWLLHDDSAPEPDCLAELLQAVTTARSIALAGPKQVDWDDPDLLLEVGLRATGSARRANDIVSGEIDQGQHDDRSDVLAVGTAGALISRRAWEGIGGASPDMPLLAEGLELSHALRLAGHRVVVVPGAVIRHRRATYLGLRGLKGTGSAPAGGDDSGAAPRGEAPEPPEAPDPAASADPSRSFRARRTAQLAAWATISTRPLLPLLAWILLLALGRGAWRLLTKEPGMAGDELAAALAVASRPARIRRGRRRLASFTAVPRAVLAELYLDPAEIRAARRDRGRQERQRLARAAAPSELELRELAVLAARRRRALGIILVLTTVCGLTALSDVLTARSVMGGALASLGEDWRVMWDSAWSTWAGSADGYPTAMTPFLAVLSLPMALAGTVGISGDMLVHLLLLVSLPLAGAGAWFAAGTVTRRIALRAWAALTWAAAPSLLLAVGQGRLAPLTVHLLLPWALVALARAVGADRRDRVLSGLVGAHRVSDDELARAEGISTARMEELGELEELRELGELGAAEASDDSRPESDGATGEEAGESAEDAERSPQGAEGIGAPDDPSSDEDGAEADDAEDAGDESAVDAPPRPPLSERLAAGIRRSAATARATASTEHYGPGSPTAAAVAGLLLAAITAAAPATAGVIVPLLLLLIAAKALGRARGPHRAAGGARRLLLTLVPAIITPAPVWWRAWQLHEEGGGAAARRLLLAEPGAPVITPAPGRADLLLGSPIDLASLIPGGHALLAVRLLLSVVPLLALVGLLASGRRGTGARAGVLAALGALSLAVVTTGAVIGIGAAPSGARMTVTGWPGAAQSLALAGMLAAALAGADAARSALVQRSHGWFQIAAPVACALVLAPPLLLGGGWALAIAHGDRVPGQARAINPGAPLMALRSAAQQIPLIARELQRAPEANRVLVLGSTGTGDGSALTASLWRGDGLLLTDVLPEPTGARLDNRSAPSAQADSAAGEAVDLTDSADASLAAAIADTVAGQGGTAADELSAHGIGVVLLIPRQGDETTATARAGLASTPGLEELARTEAGVAWRVSPGDAAQSARAVLLEAAGGDGGSATTVPFTGLGTTTTIPASASGGDRVLVLAERADPLWTATLNGRPLQATTRTDGRGQWQQAFLVPAQGGELTLAHSSLDGRILAASIMTVWAVTALAALPLRRRRYA